MGRHWKLMCAASGLWTLAIALAISGTFRQELFVVLWALLVALVACITTGAVVAIYASTAAAHRERVRVERLAEIMASTAADPTLSRFPR